jgi:predicted dinucleotide-binding enzyme
MRIIIFGAGRVGESVAESLVSEQNDIISAFFAVMVLFVPQFWRK